MRHACTVYSQSFSCFHRCKSDFRDRRNIVPYRHLLCTALIGRRIRRFILYYYIFMYAHLPVHCLITSLTYLRDMFGYICVNPRSLRILFCMFFLFAISTKHFCILLLQITFMVISKLHRGLPETCLRHKRDKRNFFQHRK